MAYFHNDVLDAALSYFSTNTENLYITDDTGAPDTFTKASATYKCGTKSSPSFTGPADDGTAGRKITVDAISDGSIATDGTTTTATAQYFALTDDSESKLLMYEELASTQSVTEGNTFTLTAFKLSIPDAT